MILKTEKEKISKIKHIKKHLKNNNQSISRELHDNFETVISIYFQISKKRWGGNWKKNTHKFDKNYETRKPKSPQGTKTQMKKECNYIKVHLVKLLKPVIKKNSGKQPERKDTLHTDK